MKKCIVIAIIFGIMIGICLLYINNNDLSYEWIKEEESIIGEERLFIKDKNGNHIDGTVVVTYQNNKSEKISVSKDGSVFVRKIILEVKNPKKKK